MSTKKRTSAEYWKQRARLLEATRDKVNEDHLRVLGEELRKTQKSIEKEIDHWYRRLADNNGVSLAKAQELLKGKELAEFRWTLKDYIKHGEANAISQKYLKELENASARSHITRMQELEWNLRRNVEQVFAKYNVDVKAILGEHYRASYEDIAKGFGINTSFDVKKLNAVLSRPWTADGLTFSKRIWNDQSRLMHELHKELTHMCITGSTPNEAIKNIAKAFGVSEKRAKTLVTTESTRMAAVGSREAYEDAGVEYYEILAEVDDRTSDICLEMDGKVFEMSDFEEGVTAPPFHANCRSIIAGCFPELDSERPGATKSKIYTDNMATWGEVSPKDAKTVVEKSEVTIGGNTYVVDGKHVLLDHSSDERKVAEVLATKYGKMVELVPRVLFPQNVSTPDYLIENHKFDLKSISGVSKNTIYNAVKRKKRQSNNFVLDITKSKFNETEVMKQIEQIYRSDRTKFVDQILVYKDEKIVRAFKRK